MKSQQMMERYLPLEVRSPRGGGGKGGGSASKGGSSGSSGSSGSGSSSSSSGGSTIIIVNNGGGHGSTLPAWVIAVIIISTLFALLFLCSLTYYIIQERRRKKEGNSFRLVVVLWKAIKITFFLWVPIEVWSYYRSRRIRDKQRASREAAGSYSKIEGGDAWYGAASSTTEATVRDSSYGVGGEESRFVTAESKYEPMGYAGVTTPDAKGVFGASVSPPPYSSSATTAVVTPFGGEMVSPVEGRERDGYFGRSTSMRSTYAPSAMSSGRTTPVQERVAYLPPVQPTYVPSATVGPRYGGQ